MTTINQAGDSPRDYYDHYWSEDGYSPTGTIHPKIREAIATSTNQTTSCLDVGCGDGQAYGNWLSARVGQYVGVDVSREAVALAQARGLKAQLIDDASSLPFSDESFDVIVCIEVLEHLFRPDHAVREMRRVLKKGGTVIATVPNIAYWRRRADIAFLGRWNPVGDDLSAAKPWRDPHLRFFTPKALDEMFKQEGFERRTVGGHGGAFVRDIPGLRRLPGNRPSSLPYLRLEAKAPGLFSSRLDIIAG